MRLSRLHKTLAAVGILIFFTFGAFAISSAYEAPPPNSLYTPDFQYLSPMGPAHLCAPAALLAAPFETADLPGSSRPFAYCNSAIAMILPESAPKAAIRAIPGTGVPLQILQSALLL